MNISKDAIKIAKLAAQTVKNPTNIPTGDVVQDLIKKLFEENENNRISNKDVIELLESQGFSNASIMKEFIKTQIEIQIK